MSDSKKTVVLNSDADGYGDAVLSSWISEGARGSEVELVHFATGRRKEFLKMLGQEVTDNPADAVLMSPAYGKEIEELGKRPRVDYRREYLGITTPVKRPLVRDLLPKYAEDFAQAVWVRASIKNLKLAVLFPGVCYPVRAWPTPYWVDLSYRLHECGFLTATLMESRDERFQNCDLTFFGQDWWSVAALLRRTDVVIGNDSGPAHLSGTMGRKTIALMGPTLGSCVFSHVPEVKCMSAGPDRIACTGCHFRRPVFRAACDRGCQSLYRVFVEDVAREVERWQ